MSSAGVEVGGRSVSSVPATAAGQAQLNGPAHTMIGSGQLSFYPPVVLLCQNPQPDLALD
ncbi:MAG: hypothetical protein WBQ21_08135 [Solirubrobacteraceae bacterium]